MPEDQEITYGDSVQLTAITNYPDSLLTYSWYPAEGLSCNDCPAPWASPSNQTDYVVNIVDRNGCQISDGLTIIVNKKRDVFIPTGFSPNGDNINDVFMVHGADHVTDIRILKVFDRWGELVFEAKEVPVNDPTFGWDGTYRGKLVNSGTYVYYTEILFVDGETFPFKGEVTLLR